MLLIGTQIIQRQGPSLYDSVLNLKSGIKASGNGLVRRDITCSDSTKREGSEETKGGLNAVEWLCMNKQEEFFDEEFGYDLLIWVETTKSFDEFEFSLFHIIDPIPIENHKFKLGAIDCQIRSVNPDDAPIFPGIPSAEYRYCVIVPKVDYLIWGCFDHQFAFAMTLGLRTKFSCRYMVTANEDFFVAYSGTNLPMYLNTSYKPWVSGELIAFRQPENIEVQIPKLETHAI